MACEVERLLAVIGGRWKLLLFRELFDGPRRHGELRRALPGIRQEVLTGQRSDPMLDGAPPRPPAHSPTRPLTHSPTHPLTHSPTRRLPRSSTLTAKSFGWREQRVTVRLL